MKAKTVQSPRKPKVITKKADQKILQLFPTLNFYSPFQLDNQKNRAHKLLAVLRVIGNQKAARSSDVFEAVDFPVLEATKALRELSALSLVDTGKKGKVTVYSASTAGCVALMAFEAFRDWEKIKTALAVPEKKNDPLAYALLVIGFSTNKSSSVYQTLCVYASQGAVLEDTAATVAAESLLSFYRQQLRTQSPVPPCYLNVFKEFTTSGFQDLFRMLLVAVKPTVEDYNWLIEFFNEISEFYFDPARIAFINLLPENEKLRQKLEEFKKSQDQQIKKEHGNLEVTFTIPCSGASKIDTMPPHLRAVGMRLILEPMKFINSELVDVFWCR